MSCDFIISRWCFSENAPGGNEDDSVSGHTVLTIFFLLPIILEDQDSFVDPSGNPHTVTELAGEFEMFSHLLLRSLNLMIANEPWVSVSRELFHT